MNGFRLGFAALAIVVAMSGCVDGSETSSPASTERTAITLAPPAIDGPAREREARFDNPLVQNTYEVALTLCETSGPSAIAAEYDVSDPSDLDAVARAYSMDSVTRDGHRDAAYIGCLEGLTASNAG